MEGCTGHVPAFVPTHSSSPGSVGLGAKLCFEVSTGSEYYPSVTDLWGGAVVKNPPANVGDVGPIPELGRSPGEESRPLQYSCLGNPHGQSSLAGYPVPGVAESDRTEGT